MSAYLKSVDSNHLVTIGEEGFWGYYDASMAYNPENSVSPWAALTGDNFTAQHNFKDIDFASIHYWPDEWVSPSANAHVLMLHGYLHAYMCTCMYACSAAPWRCSATEHATVTAALVPTNASNG